MLESLKRKRPREIIELSSNRQQLIAIVVLEEHRIEALIDSRAYINTINSILVQK